MNALDKLTEMQSKNNSIICLGLDLDAKKMPAEYSGSTKKMFDFVSEGRLNPYVSGRYPLDQAPQALRALLDRKVTGKVVVEPNS